MKKRKKGLIFVISAPSGSGKTTLCGRLLEKDKNLVRSVSATTREPRKGEKSGRDYYFVTEKRFKAEAAGKKFLEWAGNFGHYYGTPRRFVENARRRGKDVILSIDVQGATQVKKKCPEAAFIFIAPPSFRELKKRLRKRNTEQESKIGVRLKIAQKELTYKSMYDYIVVNDSVERALNELRAIINAERCKKDSR